MIGAIIGGALNAIGSLASGSENWYYQNRAMHEQMDWQEKMNRQQQDWQESMWNKTNEYNSPLAQLQRAKEAGINPNAVFGSAGVGGTTATMAQQPTTPSAPNGFSPNFDFGQIGSTFAQLDLLNAQKKNIEADTDLKGAQTENYRTLTPEQQKSFEKQREVWDNEIDKVKAEVSKIGSEKDGIEIENDIKKITRDDLMPLLKKTNEQQLKNLEKSYEEAQSRINQNNAQIKVMQQQVETLKAQARQANASADLMEAQKGNVEADTAYKKTQNEIAKLEKEIKNLEKQNQSTMTNLTKSLGYDPSKLSSPQVAVMAVSSVFNRVGRFLNYVTYGRVGTVDFVVEDNGFPKADSDGFMRSNSSQSHPITVPTSMVNPR